MRAEAGKSSGISPFEAHRLGLHGGLEIIDIHGPACYGTPAMAKEEIPLWKMSHSEITPEMMAAHDAKVRKNLERYKVANKKGLALLARSGAKLVSDR